jgi:hypothetical protein
MGTLLNWGLVPILQPPVPLPSTTQVTPQV